MNSLKNENNAKCEVYSKRYLLILLFPGLLAITCTLNARASAHENKKTFELLISGRTVAYLKFPRRSVRVTCFGCH